MTTTSLHVNTPVKTTHTPQRYPHYYSSAAGVTLARAMRKDAAVCGAIHFTAWPGFFCF